VLQLVVVVEGRGSSVPMIVSCCVLMLLCERRCRSLAPSEIAFWADLSKQNKQARAAVLISPNPSHPRAPLAFAAAPPRP
jgi:hypothetical protein